MTDLPDRLKATGIPACAEWDKNFGEGSFGRALTSERAETSVFRYADACIAALLDAVDEMVPKGWDGLLTILDDIYPASVFGGVDSDWHDEKRDIGPRLVTLARHLDAERHRAEKAERDRLRRWEWVAKHTYVCPLGEMKPGEPGSYVIEVRPSDALLARYEEEHHD